jgi:glycosyltransferase involved in cell wall biosynthesis
VRVLLVEPYLGGSHRDWAEGYRRHSSHEVRIVAHPAAWWKWRMRGSAVTLAAQVEELRAAGWEPEAALVSDMVDLPALRSFARLGDLPVVLYLHESQLTYPDSPRSEPDLSYAFTNWLGALSADEVWFNSGYHRDAFFDELPRLLRHFPDHTHEHLIPAVTEKSVVMPVGVELGWLPDRLPGRPRPSLITWNHRWEHDKGPGEFLEAVIGLHRAGIEFHLALCGENSRQVAEEFDRARSELGDRIVQFGLAPVDRYRRLLLESSVVASTARQEFFGVAVVEGIAAGARPVLPDRLSYPWLIPEPYHDEVLYAEGDLAAALTRALRRGPVANPEGLQARAVAFAWEQVAPAYDTGLSRLADGR